MASLLDHISHDPVQNLLVVGGLVFLVIGVVGLPTVLSVVFVVLKSDRPPPPAPPPSWRALSLVIGSALAMGGGCWHYNLDTASSPKPSLTYSEAELRKFPPNILDLLRNQIYAEHGRRFERKDLQDYFSSQPWYHPKFDPSHFPEETLSASERANIKILSRVESAASVFTGATAASEGGVK